MTENRPLFRQNVASPAISCTLLIAIILLCFPVVGVAGKALNQFGKLNKAGLFFVDDQGKALITTRADQAFIPASTTKLVTAWLALEHWGAAHRFSTDFFFDPDTKTLWVKGSGDPYLLSEEMALIAANLQILGLTQVDSIGLDVSIFEQPLLTPGTTGTHKPYDAISSAVASNFNTVAIKKIKGELVIAEPQTPLTPFTREMAKRIKIKSNRVNTGTSLRDSERYFGELLAALLREQGVIVGDQIKWGQAPKQTPFYTHVNSKPLSDIVRSMLKFSTNFVANQLVLLLSAEHYRRPVGFNDVQRYIEDKMTKRFKWQGFTIKDGSGLSRDNRLTPKQLVQLLQAFTPWQHLLPEIESGVFAKTGTLNKVRTLAGYVLDKQQRRRVFALMMNQPAPFRLRNRIAIELKQRK